MIIKNNASAVGTDIGREDVLASKNLNECEKYWQKRDDNLVK